ncbi:MAG: 2-oxoacid:acceptor oxidoreductase subunit alpha [Nocardioides sp.]
MSKDSPEALRRVVIRFAGDSGDGMQLTGERFTSQAAVLGNDLATMPDFPAEIRAPRGTLPGVSSFQIQIADHDILTPGDHPDVLVAMNPAALKANLGDLRPGGTLIVNTDEFTPRNLAKVGYDHNPLEGDALADWTLHTVAMAKLTLGAVESAGVSKKDGERAKNMFALGLVCWMFARPTDETEQSIRAKFAKAPQVAEANLLAFRAGWNYGETTEAFATRYQVARARLAPGTYRQISGNRALAQGLVAASQLSGLPLVLGSYPITPASDILHELSKLADLGVTTMQVEDEIAAISAAIGASLGGALAVTSTSGPGLSLKSEALGLAVMVEIPLVLVDVQRGGPSTGLPTRTEQSDLLQAVYGRNGESPVPVIAASSPADAFDSALEAARIAITYRTPVILLSDGAIGNGVEPWRIPALADLDPIEPDYVTEVSVRTKYQPYARDPHTLARAMTLPGTPGATHRLGGLEKANGSGAISYDAANHDLMVRLRHERIAGIEVPDAVVDDPSGVADLLVVGWGSSAGPIGEACRLLRETGVHVAHLHLRHLNPFPANLGHLLGSYHRVVAPEMNLGQLAQMLRATYLVDVTPITKVRGESFTSVELAHAFNQAREGTLGVHEGGKAAAARAQIIARPRVLQEEMA